MYFWRTLGTMLTVEFTGAVPENTLDAIIQAKIPISHVIRKSELTYQLDIRPRDYAALSGILQKRGDALKMIRKRGLYWTVKAFVYRPILLATFLLLLVLTWYLPTRIFFITVEGNRIIPDRLILAAAEDCGIRFGASRKTVRSEKVKNALLSALPHLQWAGINTSGCTAVISVRERTEDSRAEEKNIVSNLIADRDGYILSATVTSGTAHCQPGEAVKRGQLLISGYTDCGICIRASRAEGEILAQTNRKLTAIMPQFHAVPASIEDATYKISLLIGKKRINLWKDSRISDAGCGRMYEEYYVSLPGGFRLPLGIGVDRYLDYELREAETPEAQAQMLLGKFSEDYLTGQMVAGQIVKKQDALFCTEELYRLESSYTCTEMIGREQREQIGEKNGKRN